MNLGQICDEFGAQVHDSAKRNLWSPSRRFLFANQAQMEAARRAKLLIDSTTPAICQIAYTTSPILAVDPRVIHIREAIIDGETLDLTPIKLQQMIPGWRQSAVDTPRYYISDYGSNQIRLWPPPRAAGTLLLSVHREPLVPMAAVTDVPEIPARSHFHLISWMRVLAQSDEDSESYAPDEAKRENAKFIAEFGYPVSSKNEMWVASGEGAGFPDTLA